MLDLAKHIVEQRSGDFEPGKFEDRYEPALVDLVNKKRNGERITAIGQPRDSSNVIDLMTALKRSLSGASPAKSTSKKPKAKPAGRSARDAAANQRQERTSTAKEAGARADTFAQSELRQCVARATLPQRCVLNAIAKDLMTGSCAKHSPFPSRRPAPRRARYSTAFRSADTRRSLSDGGNSMTAGSNSRCADCRRPTDSRCIG